MAPFLRLCFFVFPSTCSSLNSAPFPKKMWGKRNNKATLGDDAQPPLLKIEMAKHNPRASRYDNEEDHSANSTSEDDDDDSETETESDDSDAEVGNAPRKGISRKG